MTKRTLEVLDDPELSDWQRAMLFQNIQRTRLSNERNFLNWVRASLAFITLGFVVHRFELFVQGAADPSGEVGTVVAVWVPLLFFALGGSLVALGTWEFFRVRKEVNAGHWIGITLIRDVLIITTLVSLLIVLGIFILGNL